MLKWWGFFLKSIDEINGIIKFSLRRSEQHTSGLATEGNECTLIRRQRESEKKRPMNWVKWNECQLHLNNECISQSHRGSKNAAIGSNCFRSARAKWNERENNIYISLKGMWAEGTIWTFVTWKRHKQEVRTRKSTKRYASRSRVHIKRCWPANKRKVVEIFHCRLEQKAERGGYSWKNSYDWITLIRAS